MSTTPNRRAALNNLLLGMSDIPALRRFGFELGAVSFASAVDSVVSTVEAHEVGQRESFFANLTREYPRRANDIRAVRAMF